MLHMVLVLEDTVVTADAVVGGWNVAISGPGKSGHTKTPMLSEELGAVVGLAIGGENDEHRIDDLRGLAEKAMRKVVDTEEGKELDRFYWPIP